LPPQFTEIWLVGNRIGTEIATARDRIRLVSLSIIACAHGQSATMKLNIDDRTAIKECEGSDPVHAAFKLYQDARAARGRKGKQLARPASAPASPISPR
jgi:hypothetical protein